MGYERIRGLRDVGQQRTGSYEINKSKTISAPLASVYAAFENQGRRGHWLGEVELEVRKATPGKSMRFAAPRGCVGGTSPPLPFDAGRAALQPFSPM